MATNWCGLTFHPTASGLFLPESRPREQPVSQFMGYPVVVEETLGDADPAPDEFWTELRVAAQMSRRVWSRQEVDRLTEPSRN